MALTTKPHSVLVATALLWVLLACDIYLNYTQPSPYPRLPKEFAIAINCFVYALTVIVILSISAGRNWARALYFFLTMLIALAAGYEYFHTRDFFFSYIAQGAAHFLVSCLALGLLFTPAANRWFRNSHHRENIGTRLLKAAAFLVSGAFTAAGIAFIGLYLAFRFDTIVLWWAALATAGVIGIMTLHKTFRSIFP